MAMIMLQQQQLLVALLDGKTCLSHKAGMELVGVGQDIMPEEEHIQGRLVAFLGTELVSLVELGELTKLVQLPGRARWMVPHVWSV